MTRAEHKQRQDEVLERLLGLLTADPHVLGIFYSGSVARGTHDAFSDLDVGCYLRDEDRTGREELYEAIGTVAPVLCRMWLYDLHALVLFESGVRLDLDFLRPSALERERLAPDFTIVHDPQGVLAQNLQSKAQEERTPPREPPVWPVERGDYLDWYFWMFRQSYAWAKRGAQGDERSFEKLSGAVNSMQQIRTGLIEMHIWLHGERNYLERVDPSMAHRLSATFPHLDAEEICRALRVLLDEYQGVCTRYCEKKDREFPQEKANAVRRIFDELDELQ